MTTKTKKKKGTVVFYNNKQYNSIAALCRSVGIEPYTKEYRKIKNRILDHGHSVKEAIEGSKKDRLLISRQERSNLTKEQVLDIRRLRKEEGLSHRKLAEMFNTVPSAIHNICKYRTWRNVE